MVHAVLTFPIINNCSFLSEPMKYFIPVLSLSPSDERVIRVEWSATETLCQRAGTTLAKINSQEEQDMALLAAKRAPGVNSFFIDLTDKNKEGVFQTAGGQHATYTNWRRLEPNGGKKENCVEMRQADGNWNDVSCSERRGFVCQIPIRSEF